MGRKKKETENEVEVETIDVSKVGKNAGEMLEKELQDEKTLEGEKVEIHDPNEKKSDPEPSRKSKAAPHLKAEVEAERTDLIRRIARAWMRSQWLKETETQRIIKAIDERVQGIREQYLQSLDQIAECENVEFVKKEKAKGDDDLSLKIGLWHVSKIKQMIVGESYKDAMDALFNHENQIQEEAGIYYDEIKPVWYDSSEELDKLVKEAVMKETETDMISETPGLKELLSEGK